MMSFGGLNALKNIHKSGRKIVIPIAHKRRTLGMDSKIFFVFFTHSALLLSIIFFLYQHSCVENDRNDQNEDKQAN